MATLASLVVRLGVDFADFDKKIAHSERAFSKLGRNLERMGANLTKGLTLPLVSIGATAVASALKIDDALDSIRTGTGTTGKEFEALGKSFKTVLGSVPSSVEDVASAIGTLSTRTGASGERLENLSRQMLNLARLTKSDVGPLISSTTKIFGDWNVATEHQSSSLDFLFKVSQQTGVAVGTLADTLTQFGAPLRALGFSLEEASTLLGKFEKEGVNTEAVLAGLRTGLGKLAKAGEEPAETFKRLVKTIGEMSSTSDAGKLAIEAFGIKAGPQLASAIRDGRFAIDDLLKTIRDSPETIDKAAKATDGFAEQFATLKNKVILAIEPLGVQLLKALESILPWVLDVADGLGELAGHFNNLPGPAKTAGLAVGGIAVAAGPTLIFFGILSSSVSSIIQLMPVLTKVWVAYGTAMTTATGPIGLVVAALVALGFALNETWKGVLNLKKAWDEGRFFKELTTQNKDNWIRRGLGLDTGIIPEVKQLNLGLSSIPPVLKGIGTSGREAAAGVTGLGKDFDLTGSKAKAIAAALAKAKEVTDNWRESVRNFTFEANLLFRGTFPQIASQATAVANAMAGLTLKGFIPAHGAIITTAQGLLEFNAAMGLAPVVIGKTRDELEGLTQTGSMFGRWLDSIPQLLKQAFTGGGGLSGALKAFFAGVGEDLGESLFGRIFKNVTGTLGTLLPGIGGAIGSLLGPLAGKIGDFFSNLFGGQGRKTNKLRDEFVASAGGLDKLKAAAAAAGFSLDKLLSTKKVKDFEREVAGLNAKIKEHEQAIVDAQRRWEGLQIAVTGVNARAQAFADTFSVVSDAGQAAFERLGRFVAATFAGMVKESGDALGALQALAPALGVLQKGMSDFGFTGTATINRLLEMFRVVNEEGIKPIFESLTATGQIFQGLQQAGILTASLFQDVGADIGQSFRELEAKGVDMSVAMALSQPVLQRLFEAQKIFGNVTDETTQKILKQAQEQGIVGDHMKDVNQKILDVLIAIADVFGADIPDALRGLKSAAKDAASDIEKSFEDLHIPPIHVPIIFDSSEFPGVQVPAFASGGIVRHPTFAMVGEAGPEAIIPLSDLETSGGVTVNQTVILNDSFIDSPDSLRRMGEKVGRAISRDLELTHRLGRR